MRPFTPVYLGIVLINILYQEVYKSIFSVPRQRQRTTECLFLINLPGYRIKNVVRYVENYVLPYIGSFVHD